MFHSSESIILKEDRRFIKSKKKPSSSSSSTNGGTASGSHAGGGGGPLRTRASTWSASEDKMIQRGRKISLMSYNPFHPHAPPPLNKRQPSTSSQNSNVQVSAQSPPSNHDKDSHGHNMNSNHSHNNNNNRRKIVGGHYDIRPWNDSCDDGHNDDDDDSGERSENDAEVVDPLKYISPLWQTSPEGTSVFHTPATDTAAAAAAATADAVMEEKESIRSTRDNPKSAQSPTKIKSPMVHFLSLPILSSEDDAESEMIHGKEDSGSDRTTPRACGSSHAALSGYAFSCDHHRQHGGGSGGMEETFPISLFKVEKSLGANMENMVEWKNGNNRNERNEKEQGKDYNLQLTDSVVVSPLFADDDDGDDDEEDVLYPSNMNIQTSYERNETCPECSNDDDGGESQGTSQSEVGKSMSVAQKSHDTMDTPNSWGSSRVSVVRFVDDGMVPSYQHAYRKPPPSLLLEEEEDNKEEKEVEVMGLMKQPLNELQGKGLYSPNEVVIGTGHVNEKDVQRVGSNDDVGHSYLESSNLFSRPKLLSHDQIPKHDRQQSLGQSTIDSLEYNSMKNMDSDRLSKVSFLFGEYDSDEDLNVKAEEGKGMNRTSNAKEDAWRWLTTCWCLPNAPKLSWSRVSSTVVRYAPCFWCCLRRSGTGVTDRVTLTRLNVLCAFFALWQFAVGIFIMVVFLSNRIVNRDLPEGESYRTYYKEALTPNLWMMTGSLLLLSVVGFVVFVTVILTIPVIRRVNLIGAIRFMWVLYWILPLQIFLVIALFDYHNVTEVWIKHWWTSPSMAWFRFLFCEPGTSNSECAAPFLGGENYTNITEWCQGEYDGDTDCEGIRKRATDDMERASYFFFYLNAILGGVLVLLLLLSLGLLEGLISAPIVQRSKESNVPLWLTFPIIFCFGGGLVLAFSPQSFLNDKSGPDNIYWISVCYILSGATFTVSALLGWFISAKTVLSTRDKKQKDIAIYLFIIMMILTIGAVVAIFTASLGYSLNIVQVEIGDELRGRIACYVDAVGSCTKCKCLDEPNIDGCNPSYDPKEICPEWTVSDVTKIIQTQLKQSATLAAILFIYAFAALRFGFVLCRAQSKYQIAYV